MSTQLTFRIFKNNVLVATKALAQSVIKLGKVPSAHVQVDDESVSRMHAIIEVNAKGEASLIDLGSTRGTFVNGQRINKAVIKDGDVLVLGDTRLELSIGPASAQPALSVVPPIPAAAKAPHGTPARGVAQTATAAQLTTPAVATATSGIPSSLSAPQGQAAAEEITGAKAVEVAAMLGDSVVDVKHCMDPRSGKVSTTTKAMFAVGAVSLLASAAAFASSVSTAAHNKAGLEYWTRTLHKPSYAYRADFTSPATDGVAAAGGLLGLLGVTLGLARVRRERRSPSYRIGTAPGVELALENTPTTDYPLVAPKGDDFVFNLAPGMEGEMILDGRSTPLSQIQGSPSTAAAGAIELPIPARAKIRAKQGQATFLISAVNKPAEQKTPLFALDGRAMKYAAGSLAAHLAMVMIMNMVPVEATGTNFSLGTPEDVAMRSKTTETEDPNKEKEKPSTEAGSQSEGGGGSIARDEEGKSGKENAPNAEGRQQIKRTADEISLAREEAREYARSAGILGSSTELAASIAAITGTADITSYLDEVDTSGMADGPDGDMAGDGGFGNRRGKGLGTCPPGVTTCGLVGSGRFDTIGDGPRAGRGYTPGNGHGGDRGHTAQIPFVPGKPTINGDLDKAIIWRYWRRQSAKVAYCYESALLADASLGGEMMVSFMINGDGTVSNASAKGVSGQVSSCVADVTSHIQFPKPANGGVVQVNIPLNFKRVGG